jgi:hypothetical protein
MAGDWLKMEVDLPEKPEVWRIASIVGIDADTVVGKLLKVWRWFDAHTEDGNALGVTYPLVDHVAGVTGFAEAMALCGWLVQSGSVMSIPHFDRHNGKTAKNRALTAKRVAKCKEKGNGESNARSVTTALPREEKRREEKEQEPASASADFLGASKGASEGRKSSGTEIDTWLRSLDGDAIPADDPIFGYAEKAGIPLDFLELSWHRFVEDMRGRGKRQKDWRAHYRNAVRNNWLKLWWFSPEGDCRLTTAGEQAKRAHA